MSLTYRRNLLLTVMTLILAGFCVSRGESQVALACLAFVGGLWLRSGRGADDGGATTSVGVMTLALVLVAGCKFTGEIADPLGIATDQVTMTPQASPSCTSGKACLYAKSGDSRVYVRDAAGLELQANYARAYRSSSSCSGLSSPALGDVCFDTTLGQHLYYTASGWVTAVAEQPFVRTCTLTSAAATAPVPCLSDAQVPPGKRAYLASWHLKVSGATAWATTATCWIRDTAGTSNNFVTVAVAALTGNAFVADHSANVTQQSPYALGTGTTADLGLEIACDAAGTGSDLVVTVYGVVK